MANKKSERTIVNEPLSPLILKEIAGFTKRPLDGEEFKSEGNWTNIYRIWGCHGFRESGNFDVGFLKIQRIVDEGSKSFSLKIIQQIASAEGVVNIIEADIKCSNDRLATPVEWRMVSSFTGADKNLIPAIGTEETGQLDGDKMEVECGDRKSSRKIVTPITSDWCILEAVQRLSIKKGEVISFNLLEELSVLKQEQRLAYRGVCPVRFGSEELSLQWFAQVGRGVLPYDYWLDKNHRLVLAASMNKAYILDEDAEAKAAKYVESQRAVYMKKKAEGGYNE